MFAYIHGGPELKASTGGQKSTDPAKLQRAVVNLVISMRASVIHVLSIRTSMPIKVVLGDKSMVLTVFVSGSEANYAPKSIRIRNRMVFLYSHGPPRVP